MAQQELIQLSSGGRHGAAGVGDTVVIIAHEVGTGRGLLVEFVHRAE